MVVFTPADAAYSVSNGIEDTPVIRKVQFIMVQKEIPGYHYEVTVGVGL